MVPSVDTYLQKEVTKMLDIILNECYIIDEVLRDFDSDVVETFKKAYCGDNPKFEIKPRFAFPDIKQPFLASYIIQLGDGMESKDSLGGVEGVFLNKEMGYEDEIGTVERDGERLYLETTKSIGSLLSSRDISFAQSDNVEIEGNRLYFALQGNEMLEGKLINIAYASKYDSVSGEDPSGTQRGFTATETVNITSISNNVDTVRCLDAILKVILIMLRQTPQEQNYYGLQKIRFSALAPVINDGETVIHGRSATLTYTISYSVDYNVVNTIKEVVLKGTMKYGN